MTLTESEISASARALFEAERSGVQTGLLSRQFPQMDMDDAYAVQAALVANKLANGRRVIGRKIGLTSKAMQAALNIETPDSGVLFDDMLFANASVIPKDRFIQPRIEAEIAFIMHSAITQSSATGQGDAPVTRDDVVKATDCVTAALEILDTRILRQDPDTGETRKIVDTIADNAANAGIVTADSRHAIDAFDIRWVGAIVSRNGEVEETGLGAGVLNDPVTSVVWLANRLLSYGDSIGAGDVILSGSFIRPVEAVPGSHIEADFGSFGTVSVSFE